MWVAPNMAVIPEAGPGRCDRLAIFTAVDNGHTLGFVAKRAPAGFKDVFEGKGFGSAKPWSQMTAEERQDAPNDYEAQVSQGPDGIPNHSEEHLARSDTGIGVQRRVLRCEIKKAGEGQDPINVAFRAGEETIIASSGNFFTDAPIEAVAGASPSSRVEAQGIVQPAGIVRPDRDARRAADPRPASARPPDRRRAAGPSGDRRAPDRRRHAGASAGPPHRRSSGIGHSYTRRPSGCAKIRAIRRGTVATSPVPGSVDTMTA